MQRKETAVVVAGGDALFLEASVKTLAEAGYRAFGGGTGEEALSLCRKRRPALAVMDVRLAGMDGYEACRRLRQEPGAETEVFLVTGDPARHDDRLKAYQSGAVALFQKPLRPDRLASEVRFFLAEPQPLLQMRPSKSEEQGVLFQAPPSPAKVLVIEDDDPQLHAISVYLEAEGLLPYAAQSGRCGLMMTHKLRPQAVVLDMNLPDMSGKEVFRLLKSHPRTERVPILVWTGSKEEGLELTLVQDGAEAFLIKGVNAVSAVPARIKNMLGLGSRRSKMLRAGPVEMNLSTRQAWVYGAPLRHLTHMEYNLLAYVVERSREVVAWQALLRDVWQMPEDLIGSPRAMKTVETHLGWLRTKLGRAGPCLVTHRSEGLQFDPDKAS